MMESPSFNIKKKITKGIFTLDCTNFNTIQKVFVQETLVTFS